MDVLIYVLWDMVLPDVMTDHVRTIRHFQPRVMNRAERIRLGQVEALTGNIYIYIKKKG
jgi:hypothetical protein